jgi:hypothetical protein
MRIRSFAVIVSSVVFVPALGATPALAADSVDTSVQADVESWQEAADLLGTAGSLWRPSYTAGLKQDGTIDVVAEGITMKDGAVTGGSTFAGSTYGSSRKEKVTIVEKWAQTDWAADPETDIRRALVGSATISLGDPGIKVDVPAKIYANCYTKPLSGDAPPPPKSLRCTKADVRKYGGTLVMTARPSSTMGAPGRSTLQIDADGLSYKQLVRVASSLQQVPGDYSMDGLELVGSAEMRGICGQMVGDRMSLDAAQAFAQQSGYTVRPGSIDGVGQALTMDFRTDRVTVTLEGGVVTGCSYG